MGQTINDCCPCKYLTVVAVPRGEGGTKFSTGRLTLLYHWYTIFDRKVPFCIPVIDKWFLFHILVYNVESLLTAANALSFK